MASWSLRRLSLAATAKSGVAGKCAHTHDTISPTRGDANMREARGKINRVRELYFAAAGSRLRDGVFGLQPACVVSR